MEDKHIEEVLTRGVAQIFPDKKSLSELMQKRKIRLYQGFDPSAASLHLGNLAGLIKLRQFQNLGHEVIFLVGDFTGMIGDPTDKSATRKKMSREQVLANAGSWKEQVSKILDFTGPNAAKILYNSEWSDTVSFRDLIEITSSFTVQQLIERDMFQDRLKEAKPIYLHEFLYPVAQAYDSVCMDVDLEIGGSDQIFNMMTGRTLMKAMNGKDKWVLGTKLLVDKDGNKVGKTTGNALFLNSTPDNFYAGIMSFPDEVIGLGFELLTGVDISVMEDKIRKDPMGEKKHLAEEVTKLLWGEKSAAKAGINFENTFQKKRNPENALEISVSGPITIIEFIAQAGKSRSEIKRLLEQNAVDVDGATISQNDFMINGGENIRIGKKLFLRAIRNQ
jgi:tyrosyl-tRNA synthetase